MGLKVLGLMMIVTLLSLLMLCGEGSASDMVSDSPDIQAQPSVPEASDPQPALSTQTNGTSMSPPDAAAGGISALPSGIAADLHKTLQLLQHQNSKLTRDLRRIQREIAALRADLDEPGLQEIFSGIGYILGLFGVAAFMAARNKET